MNITINGATLEYLKRRGANASTAEQVGPDAFEVDVDDEVKAALERVHPDPNEAIRILATTGVGRA